MATRINSWLPVLGFLTVIGCGPAAPDSRPGPPSGPQFALRVPFPCGVKVRIFCGYGPRCSRAHKGKHGYGFNDHFALDMARDERGNGLGKPVVAAASGVVLRSGWITGGCAPVGQVVYLEHTFADRPGHRYQTLYAHLHSVRVKPGQRVPAGTVIGTLGGSSRGKLRKLAPHLHFAVTRDARPRMGGGHAVKPEPLGSYRNLRSGLRLTACGWPTEQEVAALR